MKKLRQIAGSINRSWQEFIHPELKSIRKERESKTFAIVSFEDQKGEDEEVTMTDSAGNVWNFTLPKAPNNSGDKDNCKRFRELESEEV